MGPIVNLQTFLAALGRFDEAWSYLQIAQQIDPFSYRQKASYARLLFWSRRYKEAAEHFSKPLMYGPLPPEVLVYQALVQVQLGHGDGSEKDSANPAARCGRNPCSRQRSLKYTLCAETEPWRRESWTNLDCLIPPIPTANSGKAALSLALGDANKAISLLNESWEAERS